MNWYRKASMETIAIVDRKVDLAGPGTYTSKELDVTDIDGAFCISYNTNDSILWNIMIRLLVEKDVLLDNIMASVSVDGWHDTLTKQLLFVTPWGNRKNLYRGELLGERFSSHHRSQIQGVNVKITAERERYVFNYLDAPAPNKYKKPRWGR